MRHREFEELAFAHWERIPEEYKQGIDGVRVLRRSKAHDDMPDVWTMGECVTEAYPSDYGGPDTIRSAVVLYWGSFVALSEQDADFDWEDELWETLTHELRHHLESLAAEDSLEEVDYAADENFKRWEGEPFDPFFYRSGDSVGGTDAARLGGVVLPSWRVETALFAELAYPPAEPPSGRIEIEWLGARHAFELPMPDADVTFARLSGGIASSGAMGASDGPRGAGGSGGRVDEATLVLVRRTSVWRAALDALRGRPAQVAEVDVDTVTVAND